MCTSCIAAATEQMQRVTFVWPHVSEPQVVVARR